MCRRCHDLVPLPDDAASEAAGHGPSLYSQFFEYLALNPRDYPGNVCYFTQALTLLGEEIFYQSRVHLRHDPCLVTRVMTMMYAFVQEYGGPHDHRHLDEYTPHVFPSGPHPIEGIHILGFHYRYDADWVLQWGPFKRGPCWSG